MIKNKCEGNTANDSIITQRGKLEAFVTGNKRSHEGTINVIVIRKFPHSKYKKIVKREKKYLVDYPSKKEIPIGTKVLLYQIAKVSKKKSFRIEKIME